MGLNPACRALYEKLAKVFTAEGVERAKPEPDCFLLAAKKPGVKPGDCLVLEEAPAEIAAVEAAAAQVGVVTATHQHLMQASHSRMNSQDT